jgi:hypothetical protein
MNNLVIIVPIVIALSGGLLWLLLPQRNTSASPASSFHPEINETLPSPRHYKHFRQIRQALCAADTEYLMKFAPPQVAKQALRERRAVARGFLKGLHEDFSSLTKLGRIIAALSPEVNRRQETERLLLTGKFQILYGLILLRLSMGNTPIEQLEHLTGLVGSMAARMDEAMAKIAVLSASQQITGSLGS